MPIKHSFYALKSKAWVAGSHKNREALKQYFSGLSGVYVDYKTTQALRTGGEGVKVTLYGKEGTTYHYLFDIERDILKEIQQSLDYDEEKRCEKRERRNAYKDRSFDQAEDRMRDEVQGKAPKVTKKPSTTFTNAFTGLVVEELPEDTRLDEAQVSQKTNMEKGRKEFERRMSNAPQFAPMKKKGDDDEDSVWKVSASFKKKGKKSNQVKTESITAHVLPESAVSLIPAARERSRLAKEEAKRAYAPVEKVQEQSLNAPKLESFCWGDEEED